MNLPWSHLRAALEPSVRADTVTAFIFELARFDEHVRHLRRRFGRALRDPDEVIADLNLRLWELVQEGCDADRVQRSYSRTALYHRGIDAIRRQDCEEKYLDVLARDYDPGHRRTSSKRREE